MLVGRKICIVQRKFYHVAMFLVIHLYNLVSSSLLRYQCDCRLCHIFNSGSYGSHLQNACWWSGEGRSDTSMCEHKWEKMWKTCRWPLHFCAFCFSVCRIWPGIHCISRCFVKASCFPSVVCSVLLHASDCWPGLSVCRNRSDLKLPLTLVFV